MFKQEARVLTGVPTVYGSSEPLHINIVMFRVTPASSAAATNVIQEGAASTFRISNRKTAKTAT
jgi:hypothetical protein